METLLHINSNRDDHTEYTKTRVSDQTGNFIILGEDAIYDDDHKFPKGNTELGHSLKFVGNNHVSLILGDNVAKHCDGGYESPER